MICFSIKNAKRVYFKSSKWHQKSQLASSVEIFSKIVTPPASLPECSFHGHIQLVKNETQQAYVKINKHHARREFAGCFSSAGENFSRTETCERAASRRLRSWVAAALFLRRIPPSVEEIL